MRKLQRQGATIGFCALLCPVLAAACQPADDFPREAVNADATEPPPPPPLPTEGTPVAADTAVDTAAIPPVAGAAADSVPEPKVVPDVVAPAAQEGDCQVAEPPAAPGSRQVLVFFTCREDVRRVTRAVPETRAVLRSSLEQLLRGPTAEERAGGFHSFFGDATTGALNSVVVGQDGVARIDFDDFSRIIPNASSSAGSAQLLGQLRATIFQYPTVRAAEITFGGSCGRFWNWLQRDCMQLTPGG